MGRNKESRELIQLMQTKYPKFSKVCLCMIRNPEYGVSLSPAAKKLVKQAKGETAPKKKKGKRLCVYVDDDVYNAIKHEMEESEFETMQEFLERKIKDGHD